MAAAASLTKAADGVFSIHGKGLKLTTRDEVAPYCKALEEMGPEVTEIRLGGNTLGVEACQALAEVIQTKRQLKVSAPALPSGRVHDLSIELADH